MAYINSNEVEIFANVTFADKQITKQMLAEDVQKQIYEPDIVTSCGADFAEVGFWADDNPNNEDRLYRFVSIAGNTGKEIKIADANSQIVGTSNIKDNVGFLSGYTEGDENDSTKVIVSIIGVVPVKTNDNTIVAGDRVMSDDNGFAVKSMNNLGYRVLNVNNGLLTIVVSPNTDMIQRINTDMLENVEKFSKKIADKQDKLTAGENITIENNVISANVVTDYDDLTNQPIKNLALSMTEHTMLTDIADGCYIVTEQGYIKTTNGYLRALAVGTELIVVTYNGIKAATYQSGRALAFFNNDMTADDKQLTVLNTSHMDSQITEGATDDTIPTSKAVKNYADNLVANKIDKSAVGNGLKFADGMLQLDIPVASASTTYGGDAQ